MSTTIKPCNQIRPFFVPDHVALHETAVGDLHLPAHRVHPVAVDRGDLPQEPETLGPVRHTHSLVAGAERHPERVRAQLRAGGDTKRRSLRHRILWGRGVAVQLHTHLPGLNPDHHRRHRFVQLEAAQEQAEPAPVPHHHPHSLPLVLSNHTVRLRRGGRHPGQEERRQQRRIPKRHRLQRPQPVQLPALRAGRQVQRVHPRVAPLPGRRLLRLVPPHLLPPLQVEEGRQLRLPQEVQLGPVRLECGQLRQRQAVLRRLPPSQGRRAPQTQPHQPNRVEQRHLEHLHHRKLDEQPTSLSVEEAVRDHRGLEQDGAGDHAPRPHRLLSLLSPAGDRK